MYYGSGTLDRIVAAAGGCSGRRADVYIVCPFVCNVAQVVV